MTAWLRIADVPPKFAGATLQVTDKPAKRTVRGEHRREVAVSVGSCGILDRPSTAKAMITSAKPLPVGHGIGSASLKSPMGDAKHMDVRPSLSQRVPARWDDFHHRHVADEDHRERGLGITPGLFLEVRGHLARLRVVHHVQREA